MEKRFVYMATTCLGPNDRDSARLCNGVLTPHAADGSHEDPLFFLNCVFFLGVFHGLEAHFLWQAFLSKD